MKVLLKKIKIKKIKKSIFYLTYKILRIIRIFFSIDQTLNINEKKLILPPDHHLKLYNKLYPDYDKFLENLVKKKYNLNIIDIGANVGDTLYRILSDNNNYYCIEANDYFLKYLKINADNVINQYKNINIKIINELVGDELEGFLDNKNGTSTITKESKISKKKYSKRLDSIVLENNINKVDIIKVDTDGYDVNILKSGFQSIKNNRPHLFFEYLGLKTSQLDEYLEFISELKLIGYNKFIILDNYGKIILDSNDIEKIKKVVSARKFLDIYCSSD